MSICNLDQGVRSAKSFLSSTGGPESFYICIMAYTVGCLEFEHSRGIGDHFCVFTRARIRDAAASDLVPHVDPFRCSCSSSNQMPNTYVAYTSTGYTYTTASASTSSTLAPASTSVSTSTLPTKSNKIQPWTWRQDPKTPPSKCGPTYHASVDDAWEFSVVDIA